MTIELAALSIALFLTPPPRFQEEAPDVETEEEALTPEELDAQFHWQTGEVMLGKGLAKLTLPPEFHYLDPRSTKQVLEDYWGNPPSDLTWGMIFPVGKGPLVEEGWGVVLQYSEDGYVSDEDAHEIDYDELLADMKSESKEENEERTRQGYPTIQVVGWATQPHYDSTRHELFWAKELNFEGSPETTLNYDVRVLGRKGVLSMNAVASKSQLAEVEEGMAQLQAVAEFTKGNRYEDFDSSIDEVAAYGIAGLIAGKLALKAGLFKGLIALLVAGKKVVVVAIAALAAGLRKMFGGRRQSAA